MRARDASSTAVGVAFLRAAHQLVDHPPRILDDPVVLRLLEPRAAVGIAARAAAFDEPRSRALRSHIVLRSRFAEDQLRIGVERGVDQYVILGAGLDTFAFRQPAWAQPLRIFEVDHPASQEDKRARLQRAHIAAPDNLVFAAIDFEHEPLRDGLARHGVAFDRPVFFAWLGVTMYLTESAVLDVLRTVSAFPIGTEIVFTFAQPEDGTDAPRNGPSLAEHAASVGEPWLSYFAPDGLEQSLRAIGFSMVEFLTPEMAATTYFEGRTDGLPPPRRINTVLARV